MSTAEPAPGFRVRGRHVLFAMIAFFTVIIAVDAAFLVLAVRSYPGQVSETPFEDGLAFNRTLARQEAQARLGYAAVAEAAPDAVVVRMIGRDGAPLTGLALAGTLRRPATEAGKRPLKFVETGPGLFRAEARGIDGAWDLILSAEGFTAERRLVWP